MTAERRAAISMSIGVASAVSLYGISFGALAVASGLDVWQAQVLSLFMFSGGSQFAVIGLIAAGAPGLTSVLVAGLLGVRNGLYSLRTAPLVGKGFLRRLIAGQLTIDESTAVALAQPTPSASRTGFWITGIGIYVGWNAMTFVGALLGNALGDVSAFGLDAAAAAAFVGLLWPRLTSREPVVVAVVAAVVTAVAIPFAPTGVPVLLAALVAFVFAVVRERSPR
ncbi:MAG: AzlC family ABC transporter permease [Microbacteriaceae bacterium]